MASASGAGSQEAEKSTQIRGIVEEHKLAMRDTGRVRGGQKRLLRGEDGIET